MFNTKSREAVKDCKLNDNFYKPHSDYNLKYLLNNILDNYNIHVEKTLPKDCFKGSKKYRHTILIVLDGLGIELFKRSLKLLPKEVKEYLEKELLISEITSIFLPTTASVIPFFMTGLLPEESGIYEWWQYEHNIDEVIVPFRDVYKEKDGGEIFQIDGDTDFGKVFSESRFHKQLKEKGVNVRVYLDPSYVTNINRVSTKEAEIIEARRFTEQRIKSLEYIQNNYEEKTFHYLYDPNIDGIEHYNGVYSHMSLSMAQNLLFEIYQLIQDIKEKKLDEVQVLITADHGLMSIDYKNVLHLEKKMEIEKYLKRNSKDRIISFGGSPRECILHVKDELLDEFVKEASKVCKGYGEVFILDRLYKEGIINKDITSENFRKNMGNVIIFAYEGMGIWFDEEFTKKFKASHGGLSYDELHVPLMSYGG